MRNLGPAATAADDIPKFSQLQASGVPFKTVGPAGSGANYIVDGTADNVEIQTALNSLTLGGFVWLFPGNYNLAAPITFVGNDTYDGVTKGLLGSGAHSTTLIAPANVNCISITSAASLVLKDMGFRVAGSGSAIVSSMGAGTPLLYQAFRDSLFENLYFSKNGSGAHTGWAMDLGSPFRSRFANLEVFNLHNGYRLYSQNSAFNPGDVTFDRSFIELDDVANSIGLHLDSPVQFASMNQITFNMVELIDNAAGGTAILLNGTGAPNHNMFSGINIEQFATVINVDTGTGNRFDLNYVESIAGGTFFKFGVGSGGNHIRSVGMVFVGAKTNTVINDANTWADNPNTLQDAYLAIEVGGVANATVVAGSTRILGMRGYNSGTAAAVLGFQQYPWSKRVGETVTITGGDTTANGYVQNVIVQDDGTATSSWLERLAYKFREVGGALTRNVFYLNEYGEARFAPARHNTVALRVFVKEFANNPTNARSTTVPVMELMDNRSDRNTLWGLLGDGTIVVGANKMAHTIVLSASATVPAGLPAGTVIVRTTT